MNDREAWTRFACARGSVGVAVEDCCKFADRMLQELKERELDDSPEAVAVVIDDPVAVELVDSHVDVVVKNFP